MPAVNTPDKETIEEMIVPALTGVEFRLPHVAQELPFPHQSAIAPSRPTNKINVPEVKNCSTTFVYNYFTRDERQRNESLNEQERIMESKENQTKVAVQDHQNRRYC